MVGVDVVFLGVVAAGVVGVGLSAGLGRVRLSTVCVVGIDVVRVAVVLTGAVRVGTRTGTVLSTRDALL